MKKLNCKIGALLLLGGCVTMVSCLDDGTSTTEYLNLENAQILTFSVAHDSLSVLTAAKFSIDQVMGEVYNHDSLPFGTPFFQQSLIERDSIRVKVTYTSVSGYAMMLTVDSMWVASEDSLTVALNDTTGFNMYSADGTTIKHYTLSVNVHRIDPDSVQYERVSLSDVPPAPTLPLPTFSLPNPLPDNFPTSDYDTIYMQFGIVEQIMLVGGNSTANYNTVWAKQDTTWAELSKNSKAPLPKINGGNTFIYNGEIWFINGQYLNGSYNRQVWYSVDRGVTWKTKPSKANVPVNIKNAEVRVDADGRYFYIIDGTDVWRAALNSRL
ncbi:hypothetical protein AGMMS49982_16480 [Bacteroidia bacterium]|nr:hypothetical protein AGMMS49982_16480 [Bacteroidia bacterium]